MGSATTEWNMDSSFDQPDFSDLRLSTSAYEWSGFGLSSECDDQNRCGSAVESDDPTDCQSRSDADDKMTRNALDCITEKISRLYGDISEAQSGSVSTSKRLRERCEKLKNQTMQCIERYNLGTAGSDILLRFTSVEAALRQLVSAEKAKSGLGTTLSLSSSDSGRSSTDDVNGSACAITRWRQWRDSTAERIDRAIAMIKYLNEQQLKTLLSDQKQLEVEIRVKGADMRHVLTNDISSWPSKHRAEIWMNSVKLHCEKLLLNCMECQCRINMWLQKPERTFHEKSYEWEAPRAKRPRIYETMEEGAADAESWSESESGASDTIPFYENEYESLADRQSPQIPCTALGSDSVRSSPSLERRQRIENSPVGLYYHMAPPEDPEYDRSETQNEVPLSDDTVYIYSKGALPQTLTDSLVVNVDDSSESKVCEEDLEAMFSMLNGNLDFGSEDGLDAELTKLMQPMRMPRSRGCEDNAGEDPREEQTPVRELSSTIDAKRWSSSLKRPRKRDQQMSDRRSLPISASETALMNMSTCSGTGTANIEDHNSWQMSASFIQEDTRPGTFKQRKKLRARRILSSYSDIEQACATNIRSQYRQGSVAVSKASPLIIYSGPPVPPSTPDLDDTALEDSDNGAGESMALHDGCKSQFTDCTPGDCSDFEWDDYRPDLSISERQNSLTPNGSAPPPQSTEFSLSWSETISPIATPIDFSEIRPQPIGSSDCYNLENVNHLLAESRIELQEVKATLKLLMNHPERGATQNILLNRCENNKITLESAMRQARDTTVTWFSDELKQMLVEWQDIKAALVGKQVFDGGDSVDSSMESHKVIEDTIQSLICTSKWSSVEHLERDILKYQAMRATLSQKISELSCHSDNSDEFSDITDEYQLADEKLKETLVSLEELRSAWTNWISLESTFEQYLEKRSNAGDTNNSESTPVSDLEFRLQRAECNRLFVEFSDFVDEKVMCDLRDRRERLITVVKSLNVNVNNTSITVRSKRPKELRLRLKKRNRSDEDVTVHEEGETSNNIVVQGLKPQKTRRLLCTWSVRLCLLTLPFIGFLIFCTSCWLDITLGYVRGPPPT